MKLLSRMQCDPRFSVRFTSPRKRRTTTAAAATTKRNT